MKKLSAAGAAHENADNILTPEEIGRLLDAASGSCRTLLLMAVLTGMRQGELLGLQWGDIDWHARQVHVRRQFTAGRFKVLGEAA